MRQYFSGIRDSGVQIVRYVYETRIWLFYIPDMPRIPNTPRIPVHEKVPYMKPAFGPVYGVQLCYYCGFIMAYWITIYVHISIQPYFFEICDILGQ